MFPLASNVNPYGSWSEWELSLERMQERKEKIETEVDIGTEMREREKSDCQKLGLLSAFKSLSIQTQLGKLPRKGMM